VLLLSASESASTPIFRVIVSRLPRELCAFRAGQFEVAVFLKARIEIDKTAANDVDSSWICRKSPHPTVKCIPRTVIIVSSLLAAAESASIP